MPLTLSVVRSLVVEVGEAAYAFPLAHIERMCDLAPRTLCNWKVAAFLARAGSRVVAASQLCSARPDRAMRDLEGGGDPRVGAMRCTGSRGTL